MWTKRIAMLMLGIGLLQSLPSEPASGEDRYTSRQARPYNGPYKGRHLDQIAFPMGNPYSEIECGHFYARAMASYGLLQALSGARYDAVEKVLYLDPRIAGDFRAFLCTATGFGTVGLRNGKPFVDVKSGSIEVDRINRGRRSQE